MQKIVCYTDGSCYYRNEKLGGYGVYLQLWENDQLIKEKTLNCGYSHTTSARMEVRAICVALEALSTNTVFLIEIITDYELAVNAINEGWLVRWEEEEWVGRENPDLWKRLLKAYRAFSNTKVHFIHTDGHFKGEHMYWRGNNLVDALASYKQFETYIKDGENVL